MQYKVYDIHSHIAPGIDDGSIDIKMSLEMLQSAHKQGVRGLVCSSHSYGQLRNYSQRVNELSAKAKECGINIKLYHGSEIYCNEYNISNILRSLELEIIPTLNHTNYILVEFDPCTSIEIITHCCIQLMVKGYHPVIAHVERYYALCDEYYILHCMRNVGCLFQINAYSLANETNSQIKYFARELLQRKLVTFIGSDAHRTTHRTYIVQDGIDYIYQHCDVEYAKDICYRNAELLLNM